MQKAAIRGAGSGVSCLGHWLTYGGLEVRQTRG